MNQDRLRVLTLGGVPSSEDAPNLLGSLASADLNVNMLRFTDERGIEAHVNREVDVLIVALDGEGLLTVDGAPNLLTAGDAVIVPKGAERSIRSNGERFAYLTCHGQRRGLIPTVKKRPAADG
jgi:quercetin dioxygenase-like cupin family protein